MRGNADKGPNSPDVARLLPYHRTTGHNGVYILGSNIRLGGHAFMGTIHRRLSGGALAALLLLTGCSYLPGGRPSEPAQTPIVTTPVESAKASPAKSRVTNLPAVHNDLASGTAKRTLKTGGLTVNVAYTSPLSIKRWTPDVTKPLNVSLTAITNSAKGQKIYLTKVTANMAPYDNSGPLNVPAPVVDTTNLSPGYIVTFPYTYGQVFVVPVVDTGAVSITIDFNYELVLQVTPNSKDYEKHTARDTLTIALQ